MHVMGMARLLPIRLAPLRLTAAHAEAINIKGASVFSPEVQELIDVLGPALDSELEHLVPILLKKAGVVSVAGRDNFLAVEADRALATLVSTGGEARVATALLNCLGSTKATDIKGKIAMHLDACVQRLVHGASGRVLEGACQKLNMIMLVAYKHHLTCGKNLCAGRLSTSLSCT